ncbi:MAG: acyl-CoA thioesterase II [Deltaproteobacteria bacterium]|nr:acyl-CoA thioesterase II [Deltaproteobacteria bacterium]MBW2447866.1 acyl-CoA thioesterase II [Deltaproteobacteria bacterium]
MSQALQNLISVLDLERIDHTIFRGRNESTDRTRLFGGQVAAQALVAAGRTVEGARASHSLHAYFLRGGDPAHPVIYTVDPIRDGGSFTTRRVVAQQNGKAIFNMSVSFHTSEPGFDHADAMPEGVTDPDSLPSWAERAEELGDKVPKEFRAWLEREHAIEFRAEGGAGSGLFGGGGSGPLHMWLRATGPLPEDPFLHRCLLAYASDMALIDAMTRQHVRGPAFRSVMAASLDHAIWFHRDGRIDDWVLYQQDSPSASGARGFARGSLYSRDGRLLASVAQEGLIRPLKPAEGEPTED